MMFNILNILGERAKAAAHDVGETFGHEEKE